MKIAIFTDTFLPQINGVTNTLDKLIKYYDKRGIGYVVFAPDYTQNTGTEENIQRFSSFPFFLYPECSITLPNYSKIKERLDQFKPDLIHIVTPFSMGLKGLKYGKEADVPIIASYHTNFSLYLPYYNVKLIDNLLWKYTVWFHNQCLMNFCPSQDTMEDLINHDIKNVKIWGRGIDSNLFSSEKRSAKLRQDLGISDRLAVLYVGRVSPEKDLDTFVKAALEINKTKKDEVCFVITGEGPMLEELKTLNIDNFIFTGYKRGVELSAIYASCDIFAFPSTTETYGNVILEAFASALPVVAPYISGLKENLLNNYNSLCCLPKNHEDMAESIMRLVKDDELRKHLSENAREYARDKTWDSIFSKLVSDFNEVIDDCSAVQDYDKNIKISA
ncbi:GDP-mannose-dependent alpha-mannosyltransferase [Oxobacter pfennigii]|uniref:GDP-mannose-dependent alpha-mannosyltransferase n=1 Tax=Oxobacter pfennigii TaxID=36849 RepID=A0A0P8X5W3_9CLOT|nr:glycosyltransferase family 1 protein [Oxobacter pfennigii]KPU46294.1 GDP-mannose-dependent alpha-mannosyltransferase [Oxobacter pfennigii]